MGLFLPVGTGCFLAELTLACGRIPRGPADFVRHAARVRRGFFFLGTQEEGGEGGRQAPPTPPRAEGSGVRGPAPSPNPCWSAVLNRCGSLRSPVQRWMTPSASPLLRRASACVPEIPL